MFVHAKIPDHPLVPSDYTSTSRFELERNSIFAQAWHFVGLAADLESPEAYFTLTIQGKGVVVRRAGGGIRAFLNVCRHRNALLFTAEKGHANCIRCPYHGWEYRDDGGLKKIPDAKNFNAEDLKGKSLQALEVDVQHGLIFIRLPQAETAAKLPLVSCLTGNWSSIHSSSQKILANWKIIAENAVESYHVPLVHPTSFRDYRTEDQHLHGLEKDHSSYEDLLPPRGNLTEALGSRVLRFLLGPNAKLRFRHVHLFPNKLLYYNDFFATYAELVPLSAGETLYRQIFLVSRQVKAGLVRRLMAWALSHYLIRFMTKIAAEDFALLPAVHAGHQTSDQQGVLSRREERVYHFQAWLKENVQS